MIPRLSGILLAILLLAAGCSASGTSDRERGEILKVLATRSAALNAKDLPRYVSVISPHYNDKGRNFTQLLDSLKRNFSEFEQISYQTDAPSITINGARADAATGYRMKIRVGEKELSLKGTEHLKLAKEPEGWKIIAGI